MNVKLNAVSLMVLSASACASLTGNCPDDPAQQNSLLCAAAGHHSGKNQDRVDEKKAATAIAATENENTAAARDSELAQLESVEARRDTLREELAREERTLADITVRLQEARDAKTKSADVISELEARSGEANERLQYLQSAPVESDTDYQTNLELKKQLEEELDSILEELAE